jgi:ribosomal protein S18 acetylase RimI-like enzyme
VKPRASIPLRSKNTAEDNTLKPRQHARHMQLGRITGNANLAEIQRLLKQEMHTCPTVTAYDLETALRNEDFHLLALKESDDHYAGIGSIFFQRNLAQWIAEIHDVVVDERYRGRGYGRLVMHGLLDAAKEFAAIHDTKVKLSLTSNPTRIAANGLYTSLGFELRAQATGERGTNFYVKIIE